MKIGDYIEWEKRFPYNDTTEIRKYSGYVVSFDESTVVAVIINPAKPPEYQQVCLAVVEDD